MMAPESLKNKTTRRKYFKQNYYPYCHILRYFLKKIIVKRGRVHYRRPGRDVYDAPNCNTNPFDTRRPRRPSLWLPFDSVTLGGRPAHPILTLLPPVNTESEFKVCLHLSNPHRRSHGQQLVENNFV